MSDRIKYKHLPGFPFVSEIFDGHAPRWWMNGCIKIVILQKPRLTVSTMSYCSYWTCCLSLLLSVFGFTHTGTAAHIIISELFVALPWPCGKFTCNS